MSALIISRSDWKSQAQTIAIVCYLGFSILCAETHLRAYMLYAHINTELVALVRPPMTVRSVGMVDPAQYKNGAFDSGQWVQSFSNIFPYDERVSVERKHNDVYVPTPRVAETSPCGMIVV